MLSPGLKSIAALHQEYYTALFFKMSAHEDFYQIMKHLKHGHSHFVWRWGDLKSGGFPLCAASVVRSIELCDVDIRKDLYSGIVATGELLASASQLQRLIESFKFQI